MQHMFADVRSDTVHIGQPNSMFHKEFCKKSLPNVYPSIHKNYKVQWNELMLNEVLLHVHMLHVLDLMFLFVYFFSFSEVCHKSHRHWCPSMVAIGWLRKKKRMKLNQSRIKFNSLIWLRYFFHHLRKGLSKETKKIILLWLK